jgi:hypothetical protein
MGLRNVDAQALAKSHPASSSATRPGRRHGVQDWPL